MAGARVKAFAILCMVALCLHMADAQVRGLRVNYYQRSCPRAEQIIRTAVQNGFNSDPTIPAGLIRMLFHDCFVRGCDASVLLDNADSEKLGAPNANSLRGFEVLDAAKSALEAACPGVVSCADVIAYAARDAMEVAGTVKVPNWLGGRKDGSTSVSAETLTELPAPFSNFTTLQRAFERKGLNQADLVILSGAHTIGIARCGIILQRIYNFKGTGQADPAINPAYVQTLRNLCPSNAPGKQINMEMLTPTKIDANYFNDVQAGRGLFESDNALRTTPIGRSLVSVYRVPQVFNAAFVASMRKMASIGVLTGSNGKIRTKCNIA
ncbi:peroxidase [Marchantia polymorpha subsp. ruderalis]|nr:hypothetical protein MARPO_0008s0265 [Marchantia polymorpha]BBN19312.1 hypothetical protein Mp_8g09590 [Marchantia polymorpha subsp. ruderalis]|eukprot:PTQ47524.1 hypothetical protein MARPO_0008s0265 [Marchantia polymorpha]